MDNRKESISAMKMCRFCLTQNEPLSSLYDKIKAPKDPVPLSLKILSCVGIEVFPSSRTPQYICQQCKFFMDLSFGFKQICRQGDESILQFVQHGKAIGPISWPATLRKVFKSSHKAVPADVGMVETVTTQSGATVQVMAEEVSEDEEEGEDDNVYNVKVADGPEEGKRIKIVTTDKAEAKKRSRKEFNTVSKLTRHLKAHAGERPYPCKHCSKSFIKSHHYTRHLRVKHSDVRGQTGTEDAYRCEECEETFSAQDELMYHSALHATRNLVCPLCQEKFDDVDTVTAHIKSHVNGNEFMCDFCELIFTSKEKLENHVTSAHDDELLEMEQDESSMEMDAEEEDDDNSINVKEEDGHMVVEINKAEQFMLRSQDEEEKNDNTQSEGKKEKKIYKEIDSEMEVAYEPPPKTTNVKTPNKIATPEMKAEAQVLVQKLPISMPVAKPADSSVKSAPSILKKAEEIKRQVIEQQSSATLEKVTEKKSNNNNKVESSSTASGASEKSLRLLEKELQDLKRTNTRNEATKTPAKSLESLRKRPVIHTSTPKTRTAEKREVQQIKSVEKQVVPEKKSERRTVTKESASKETREAKEPKETKEVKGNSVREEKSDKDNTKEEITKIEKKEVKEKEKEKAVVKNGVSEKPQEEGVRRSTRPSKVKDYAKMIRDNISTSEEDSDEESYEDDSKDTDKSTEATQPRGRGRKSISKTPTTPAPPSAKITAATPASAPKKRGRPRKIQNLEPTPAKIRKEESPEHTEKSAAAEVEKSETAEVEKLKIEAEFKEEPVIEEKIEGSESPKPMDNSNVMVSPSGQTLKKVPIKALPPGIKPLPLPRSMGAGEVCEMQIGKKVVKVQKIVMTKAEVEEMTKKGLVEMKDGTMVLKQGIKLPGTDPTTFKSNIIGEGEKKLESPKKE